MKEACVMNLRYLIGPVSAERARNWEGPRRDGRCLAFNARGDVDLTIGPTDTWDAVCRRLPADWRPDFIALELAYQTIPPALWAAPVPLVGLAADWNLNWHHYRHVLPRLELVLTDLPGVEVMQRAGWAHARPANLYGLERPFHQMGGEDAKRDIDILFVGNMNPAVQAERLPWLARLARLCERWRVVVRTGVFGDDYRALLRRARILFNRSIRGEWNRRVLEGAAAGALLFQEAGNREVSAELRTGEEYVAYRDDDLESLLEHYLTHEDQRRALAEAAQRRRPDHTFEALWERLLGLVEEEWPALQERARQRPAWDPVQTTRMRCWQALSAAAGEDPGLVDALAAALAAHPQDPDLHNALGLAVALAGRGRAPSTAAVARGAAAHFHRAVAAGPRHAVAALNLVEALTAAGEGRLAGEGARRLLLLLDRSPELDTAVLNTPHFPAAFDHFRVEWERAAWANAGRPAAEARAKRDLLRWRLHALLAELTGDLAHFHEAALARPDLPTTRAALGCALGRAGRPADAAAHLRQALAANPFEGRAAAALHQALGESGDADGARRLARDRRLLSRAAPQVVPAEAWFTEAPLVGDEPASIIILCCNELDCTRLCLESVLRQTRPPYELILVDNGSTDGTAAYLQQIRSRPGPARVEVITNATNRGFPAGCNQALARARGQYLVFLNNDTVVTAGWLDGLVRWALHDWPQVGLVGAVSNYTAPPQQVATDYTDLAGLDAFAARRAREYARKALAVPRLTGFCLLARREVLDKIGGFDERYGLGFFDDDDLTLRARQAGFRLLVALDVFVHHFGSRTFRGLGIDCRQQLLSNFDRFKEKWGPEHAAPYRLPDGNAVPAAPPSGAPGPPIEAGAAEPAGEVLPVPTAVVAATGAGSRPRVSLCMIVRNEEANLPDCLTSAAGLFDEVIVVDTGSTDRTREIAAQHGARVFDFAWCDSFAAARNACLDHASGDWIFWMDADDRLDEPNRQKLRALLADLPSENVAYAMKCRCLGSPGSDAATVVDHVRLFRRHPQVRWRYRVHEQILPAVREQGGKVCWVDIVIHHVGYQDPALRRRKLDRDLRLLHLEDAEHPDQPFTLFNLGTVYQELGRPAEALPLLRRSLARSHPQDSIVRKLHALIVTCHRALGQQAEAQAACREGLQVCPDDTELLFLEAALRREQGDAFGAEIAGLQLLSACPAAHFASVDAGLKGYKTRHNLAVLYLQQGRLPEADYQWRQALAERPDFLPAWLGLGECALRLGNGDGVEDAARHLDALPGGEVEALGLRARGLLSRRAFAAARGLLEAARARFPRALLPRLLLSHVFLQEGRDDSAAEGALLDILELDPDHAQARHNLAVLRARRNPAAGAA
jgi:GT2 family glycosyltransferase/Tfp pilus assembly protein PilF